MRIVLFVPLAMACANPQDPVGTAVVTVSPNALEFSSIPYGDVGERTVTIANIGTGPLRIDDLNLTRGAPFFLADQPLPITLEADETLTVSVSHVGSEFNQEAWLDIHTNVLGTPVRSVQLIAESQELALWLTDLDLGDLPICAARLLPTLRISNPTLRNVVITQVVSSDPAVTILSNTSAISSGGAGFSALHIEPMEPGDVTATISVYSDAPISPSLMEVTYSASAQWPGNVADTAPGDFVELPATSSIDIPLIYPPDITAPRALDLTFVIDVTSDMEPALSALSEVLPDLLSSLNTNTDLTVGIASFRDYALEGQDSTEHPFALVQQQTSDIDAALNAVDGLLAEGGYHGTHSAYEALYQALTGVGQAGGCTYWGQSDVPPFLAHSDDAFGGTLSGTADPSVLGTGLLGGMGYRGDAQPVLILITNAFSHNADGIADLCAAAGLTDVLDAAEALNASILAVGVDGAPTYQLTALTGGTLTTSAQPLVRWASTDTPDLLGQGLVDALGTLATTPSLDLHALDPGGLLQGWTSTETGAIATLRSPIPADVCERRYPLTLWVTQEGETVVERQIVAVIPALEQD